LQQENKLILSAKTKDAGKLRELDDLGTMMGMMVMMVMMGTIRMRIQWEGSRKGGREECTQEDG